MAKVKSVKSKPVKEPKVKKEKPAKVTTPRTRKVKEIVGKSFKDEGLYWETNKIILRLMTDEDKHVDYTRTFISGTCICVNKDKIGKKTRYSDNKWGKIVDIKENEKDLVFVLEPIAE